MAAFILSGCNPSNTDPGARSTSNQNQFDFPADSHLSPEELAKSYCGSCHLFPQPELLAKEQWQDGVLPNMGYRLGVKSATQSPYKDMSFKETAILQKAGIFPSQPLISDKNWDQIVSFYLDRAPDKLPIVEISEVDQSLRLFKPAPIFLGGRAQPLITMLVYQDSKIYVGDRRGYLYLINMEDNKVDSLFLGFPPSDLARSRDSTLTVLTLGAMDPNDLSQGELIKLFPSDNNHWTAETLVPNLPRPVHFSYADLNNDNKDEVIVCSFGNQMGRISWYEYLNNDTWTEHILKPVPGAIRSEVYDFNKDQLLDIMVMFAQGDEGITIFYNQGDGTFTESRVLRFHPVFGSSDFNLVDFNNDGLMDLACTNGDNADYSYSLKPYHGLRVYLNKGGDQFEETYFYPMDGASKVETADFDLDGDFDLAVISFFPDFTKPELESFVFLENQGNGKFEPKSFPDAAGGSWLVMERGDIDKDGDEDLLLGSFTLRVTPTPDTIQELFKANNWKVLILENTTINP